ncbi:MAG TPA: rod shape-determining protein MreC [Candidatus Moranbacteria bacterium]|nr:rod shape-determining protein MreC [Candidatus Moranbacteria bacterium]HAT74717.1 rod shape-determining protein MreC [Candidatus Moranbacteria bacterium]
MPQKYFTARIIKLIATAIVCLALIFLNPKGFFNPLRGFFLTVSAPFQKVFYQTGEKIGETIYFFGFISELKNENIKLSKENNFLAAKIAGLEQEKSENIILREQLNLLPRDKFDLIGGFIIGQDPQGSESWVIFDKGEKDGVASGMPVIVSNGILVGKVDEVYSGSSKINLLTGSNSSINAVDIETGAKGIARGEYGLGIIMDMVTQSDVLNEGDSVVTSGLGSDIPRGLLVGKIKEIKKSQDKLFQEAIIVPRVKYSKLDVVFAIK